MPLLQVDETRHVALRCLSTITHHGGATIRAQIAAHASTFTKLIRDFPDDETIIELSITVLSHSVVAVVEGDARPQFPDVLKSLDMVDIIKTTLENIKRPVWDPRALLEHSINLITMSSLNAPYAFKAYPAAISFMTAGIRSKDWVTRSACLGGLIRLYRTESEPDQSTFDAMGFVNACQRQIPAHINAVLMAYGPMRCEIYVTTSCINEFQKAMFEVAGTHDLYKLGLKQANLILKSEWSVLNGTLQRQNPQTGEFVQHSDAGLPFTWWRDSLVHAAKAIRDKGKPNELDYADILEMKATIQQNRTDDAIVLAEEALKRNPEQAYFYYVVSLSGDGIQGLRGAKKGLKCKVITPFVKFQMLQRAVDHAGDMGIKILQDMPEAGDKKWEEGTAFLMSALEDAKRFMEEAPPDNRHMKNVLYWYILLSLLIKETVSPDLRELDVRLWIPTPINFVAHM